MRKIFKEAFEGGGLPYFNPHSFRHTLVMLGEKVCQTPEQFKAWSQNLGHEKVMTTFMTYGEVGNQRQGEIIRDLMGTKQELAPSMGELVTALMNEIRNSGMGYYDDNEMSWRSHDQSCQIKDN
jgi:hypothetical protein